MKAPKYEFDYREVSIFDKKNPHAIVNMVPPQFRDKLETLDKKWFKLSEPLLKARCHPTVSENQLRIAFWHEYSSAQESNRKMKMANVYGPVCTGDYFYRIIAKTPSKLAWLVNPPAEYQIRTEEMLNLGLTRLREVLELPIMGKTGLPDHRLIGEMVKIVMILDNRVKGSVVQRMAISQQSYNVNVNANEREEPKTMREIEMEISRIENAMKGLASPDAELREIKDIGTTRSIEAEATKVGVSEGEASS